MVNERLIVSMAVNVEVINKLLVYNKKLNKFMP